MISMAFCKKDKEYDEDKKNTAWLSAKIVSYYYQYQDIESFCKKHNVTIKLFKKKSQTNNEHTELNTDRHCPSDVESKQGS